MDTPAPPPTDAQQPPDGPQQKAAPPSDVADLNKSIEKDLGERLKKSKQRRKDLSSDWKVNVQARLGSMEVGRAGGLVSGGVYSGTIEDDTSLQSTINPDWSLTKMKTANLFSQVPAIQGTHEHIQYGAAVPFFMKALNYELSEKRANVAVPMEEAQNDAVNASGIAFIYLDYQARFRKKTVPKVDPRTLSPEQLKQLPQLMESGQIPSETVPEVVDYRFNASRVSPSNGLWPADFTGSNFDDGDYLGYDGSFSWAEAQTTWMDDEGNPLLDESEKETLTQDPERTDDSLRQAPAKDDDRLSLKKVHFSHLFYWRYRYDAEELCFNCIWEIIFVKGREKPVLHRPWKGQKKDERTGKYFGAQKFPVRVLTLTYVTDNPVPPSDSAAGRPQVTDLRLSRTQLMQQRRYSTPVRGYNTDRVDPLIGDLLMRGTYQGWIPFQGKGQDAVWEMARASYPKEDLAFDQETQADLYTTWGFGGVAQQQSAHRQTKQESQSYQAQFNTLFAQERGKVARFFLGICEVLAGLMSLYSDFPSLTDQEKQQMLQACDVRHIIPDLVLKMKPDSQVVLDSNAAVDRLFKVLNMVGKSGFVNPKPIITKILEYSPDIDIAQTLIDPQPPAPEEPTISFRFTGKDDLQNPIVMALLMQLEKSPSPEMLEEAKRLLLSAQMAPEPPKPDPMDKQPHQPAKKVPPAPDVKFDHQAPVIPGVGGQPSAHPDWSGANKVIKRDRDV